MHNSRARAAHDVTPSGPMKGVCLTQPHQELTRTVADLCNTLNARNEHIHASSCNHHHLSTWVLCFQVCMLPVLELVVLVLERAMVELDVGLEMDLGVIHHTLIACSLLQRAPSDHRRQHTPTTRLGHLSHQLTTQGNPSPSAYC